MKALFTFFLILTVFSVSAQDGVIVKYFDSTWRPTSKENASFYTHFIKEDTLYRCTSYYAKSNKLYGKSIYTDTLFMNSIGLSVYYFENGNLKDSSFSSNGKYFYYYRYYIDGKLCDSTLYGVDDNDFNTYSYDENGKFIGHTLSHWDNSSKKPICVSYDEQGKILSNYVFTRKSYFKGGTNGWVSYVTKNLRSNVPCKHNAPVGKYTVNVTFAISEKGKLVDIAAQNDPGFGTKEEACRVIENAPRWSPAILNNKPIVSHSSQAITFSVD